MTLHKHDRCSVCQGDARVSECGRGWLCKACLAPTRGAILRAVQAGEPVPEGVCLDCSTTLDEHGACWRCKHDEDAGKDDGRWLDEAEL